MKCRLPMKIGTPSGGTSYPDGAFIPVTKFTAGKTYALVAKIDGVYRYINTVKFNDYTLNATEVSVTPGGGYVTFGSEPALFKAEASGDGFTLSNGDNYLYGYSDQYSTALRYDASSSVWTVDTSETGGFDSGKYLPKEVASSVWLKNASGDYEWSIKYESAGSFGYDRAGRDSTYSTGFVSFILYEKWEGQTGGGDSGGASEYAVTVLDPNDMLASLADESYFSVTLNGTAIRSAGTLVASPNAELVISNRNTQAWSVIVDGETVKSTSSSVTTYTHKITSAVTFSVGGSWSSPQFAVTTEGSSGGGGGTTPSEYALSLSGSFHKDYCYITVNNTKYMTAQALAIAAGTVVVVTADFIYLNGTQVAKGEPTTYSHTLNSNASIACSTDQTGFYTARITTE